MNHLWKYLVFGMAIITLTACDSANFQPRNGGGAMLKSSGFESGAGLGAMTVVCDAETFTATSESGGDLIWILDCRPVASGAEYLYTPSEIAVQASCGVKGLSFKRRFHYLAAYDSATFEKVDGWLIWDGGSQCDASGGGTTDDSDTDTTDEGYNDTTDESSDGTTDESYDDTTDESSDGAADESYDDTTDEGSDDTADGSYDDTADESDADAADSSGSETSATGYRARIEELINLYFGEDAEVYMAYVEQAAAEKEVDLDAFDIDAWGAENGFSDLDNLSDDKLTEFIETLAAYFSA